MVALGTRSLKAKIGSGEVTGQISSCTIDSAEADSDFTTFADAAAGGKRKYTLKFTAAQDPGDTTSVWSQMFTAAGSTVAVVVNPYGNTTASATQPFYSGNVVIKEPDGTLLGGDADASTTSRFTIECEWEFAEKPLAVTTGSF